MVTTPLFAVYFVIIVIRPRPYLKEKAMANLINVFGDFGRMFSFAVTFAVSDRVWKTNY